MRKTFSSTLLAAGAIGAMLVLPTGTATAASPACEAAAEIINGYNGALGPNAFQYNDAANRLLAIDAYGQERQGIENLAKALRTSDFSRIGSAGTQLNAICLQG